LLFNILFTPHNDLYVYEEITLFIRIHRFVKQYFYTCKRLWIRAAWGVGVGSGAPGAAWFSRSRSWSHFIFLQEPEREPEHFKKSEWSRSWRRSWHKL